MGIKLDKAREIINKFPNTSKQELGNLLYIQNPLLFLNREDGRRFIRKATGSYGALDRRKIPIKGHVPNHRIYKL